MYYKSLALAAMAASLAVAKPVDSSITSTNQTTCLVDKRQVPEFGTWPARHGPPPGSFIMECSVPNTIALTFDDGPWKYTEELLDILESFNMSATFFVNGENMGSKSLDKNEDHMYLVHRAYTEGHQIASHTWSHADLSTGSQARRIWQMNKLEDTLRYIIGVAPTYMRAPYGSCDHVCMSTMQKLGYRVVHWSLDTMDYAAHNDEDIMFSFGRFQSLLEKREKAKKTAGPIVLAHDTKEQTVKQLTLLMADYIKEKKMRAVTVGECLGEAKEFWYKH